MRTAERYETGPPASRTTTTDSESDRRSDRWTISSSRSRTWGVVGSSPGGLLTAPHTYVKLTAETGSQYHCAPMAPQRRNEVVFDWLAETLDQA